MDRQTGDLEGIARLEIPVAVPKRLSEKNGAGERRIAPEKGFVRRGIWRFFEREALNRNG